MVKGISSESSHSFDFTNIPLPSSSLYFYQDTVKIKTTSAQSTLQIPTAKIGNLNTDSLEQARVDRLFQAAEAREKSMARPKYSFVKLPEDTTAVKGSTSRIYPDDVPSYRKSDYHPGIADQNFLKNIVKKTLHNHYKTIDSANKTTAAVIQAPLPKQPPISGFEGDLRDAVSSGWYIFFLLISLSIFAWGKSLYQKYLLQIFNSVYNYQISIQLFRDKNTLFRNLSIILQILFPINFGLMIYFLINYYQFNQVSGHTISSIGLYSAGVFLFFRFKAWVYKFLGLVFKVQDDFHEIQHHLNTFVQTLGVVLLPFVISMPFVNDALKNVVLIGLFIITGVFILLLFFRGLQIVNRKQVPVFFLILYLCAVEILPVALLIKTSYSII